MEEVVVVGEYDMDEDMVVVVVGWGWMRRLSCGSRMWWKGGKEGRGSGESMKSLCYFLDKDQNEG